MESLPPALLDFISAFRPLMRAEVFDSFTYYTGGLPTRLFWLADSTLTEKPFIRRVASVGLFHRAKYIVGRARHLQGHCYVFAAHLYQTTHKHWASALVGALLYVKGRSIPRLVGDLAQQLRLPNCD
jgi:hypothetical protein